MKLPADQKRDWDGAARVEDGRPVFTLISCCDTNVFEWDGLGEDDLRQIRDVVDSMLEESDVS